MRKSRTEDDWPHETEQDLTRYLGARGVAAVGCFLLFLVGASSPAAAAQAQAQPQPVVVAVAPAAAFDLRTQALINAVARSAQANAPAYAQQAPSLVPAPMAPTYSPTPYAVMVHRESPMLGAPLSGLAAMVDANSVGILDEEANCLATAVYFESKGEPLEGQLAVAQVVLNRAASGRYPSSLCGVVKQHAQFSFVRDGNFPSVDAGCNAWRRAQAIARIATKRLVASLPSDVLWYHADYVAPRWRQALVKVEKIGAHIFYRA
jgi:N-acetylmuramoyl-L-alanine amidase